MPRYNIDFTSVIYHNIKSTITSTVSTPQQVKSKDNLHSPPQKGVLKRCPLHWLVTIAVLFMTHKYKSNNSHKCLGFHSGTAEGSLRVGYGAASRGKWIPLFWRNPPPSPSRVDRSQKNLPRPTDPSHQDLITHSQGIIYKKRKNHKLLLY